MTTENQIVIIKQQYGIKEIYFFFFIELLKIQVHSFASINYVKILSI